MSKTPEEYLQFIKSLPMVQFTKTELLSEIEDCENMIDKFNSYEINSYCIGRKIILAKTAIKALDFLEENK
jgi:hypothetical protein